MSIPEISVVIPTYNRAHIIGGAVNSVICQEGDGSDFIIKEIIVVDDNSSDNDNTEEVLKTFCDDRIVYRKLTKNGGPGNARNIGSSIASGEWIAFQDSDNEWKSEKLKKQISLAKEHSEYDLIYAGFFAKYDTGKEVEFVPHYEGDLFEKLAVRNYIDAPTMLIKRAEWQKMNGFDITFPALEDWDFALRFAYDHKIGCVSEILMTSYMLSTGVSANASNHFEAWCMMIGKNRRLLLERGVFDIAVQSLLIAANDKGLLSQVGAVLEKCLA